MYSLDVLTKQRCYELSPELLALVNSSGWFTWDEDNLHFELPRKWDVSLILYVDNVVAGCSLNSVKENMLYVHIFAIKDIFHGRGLGKVLMNGVFQKAYDCHYPRVSLHVSKKNTTAIGFYSSLGFIQYGVDEIDLHLTKILENK